MERAEIRLEVAGRDPLLQSRALQWLDQDHDADAAGIRLQERCDRLRALVAGRD